ncbi:MAG: ParA family protein [Campylobacterota bacterium]
MKTISIFNNKGGVGKTTLTYHFANALAELGHKTLIFDLDPQCNVTIMAMDEDNVHDIWIKEDDFIQDYKAARDKINSEGYQELFNETRSIHFMLKPAQDGVDSDNIAQPFCLRDNLFIIPGRLTMHLFEDKISKVWSDVYRGEPQAIRIVTQIRNLATQYAKKYGFEYVIMDTSPSLGALNKVIISTTDGFVIPAMPDLFSLYGIRNLGGALAEWKKEFDMIMHFLPEEKRKMFPSHYVKLLGYTIYNARKYTSSTNNAWNLTRAHYNYAIQIPETIKKYINSAIWASIPDDVLQKPIGGIAIMHTHNTLPNMAQKYHLPIWMVPDSPNLDASDSSTIGGNVSYYRETKEKYILFTNELIERIGLLS